MRGERGREEGKRDRSDNKYPSVSYLSRGHPAVMWCAKQCCSVDERREREMKKKVMDEDSIISTGEAALSIPPSDACMHALQWSTATADLRVVLLPVAERILLRPGIDMRHIIILSRRCHGDDTCPSWVHSITCPSACGWHPLMGALCLTWMHGQRGHDIDRH